ncbi:MAG: zinc-dependent metalloprotease family protein, partial [Pirellulaceae bacterium]|nr:zinc-dependent metalloprotease family protein [Pirellulaceae bacterium]
MQRKREDLTGCAKRQAGKFHFEKLEDRRLLAADFSPGVPYAPSQLWQMVDSDKVDDSDARIHVEASELQMYDVHETLLIRTLSQAPLEATPAASNPITMILPSPDGEFQRFEVVESPIIAEQLAKKFPGIKTYRGVGIDDPGSTLRMDITRHGFHAQVFSSDGTWMIDPYFHLEQEFYASYESANALRQPGSELFEELGVVGSDGQLLEDQHDDEHRETPNEKLGHAANGSRSSFAAGLDLRTFDTAVAATGEYTQFHGGTVSSGLAAIVTAMNRVNQIYERDIAARMILVADNDLIVYVDGNSDPYTNSSGFSMLGENQANLDNVIGDANYDLGHVFSTGGGGVAGLGVIG